MLASSPVPRGLARASLLLSLLMAPLPAGAQAVASAPPPCAAPPAPTGVKAKIDDAIAATKTTPRTPAVLTLTWKAPDVAKTPASAPVAYVIEAGSAAGQSDLGTTRTDGPQTTFTIPMPNGSYVVRVRAASACAVGDPSGEAKVKVSGSVAPGQPNPLVVLDTIHATREKLGTNAFVRVMGQVRNGWGAAPTALVPVTVTYEGAKGGLGVNQTAFVTGTPGRLRTSGLVTDTVLEPGATGCFVVFANFTSAAVTGLGVVAAPGTPSVEPLRAQVGIDGPASVAADEFDGLVLTARLKNGGPSGTSRNEFWVEARDDLGRVLDCRAASIPVTGGTLPAGQAVPLKVVTEAPFSMSRMVRGWATFEPADAAPGAGPSAARAEKYRALQAALDRLLADPQGADPQAVAAARDFVRAEAAALEAR